VITDLHPGDVAFCPAGTGHSMENIGEEPLVFAALILNA
jgi:oxalate decarboxylase/phosphoglucose isomerase-like protein (cupin superfamily)